MRIPYGYQLGSNGFIICQEKAEVVRMIFDCYLSGASLGKVADMLSEKRSLPLPGKNAGQEQQSISSCPMQSISQSLELKSIWTSNLKRVADVISTTTKPVIPEKLLGINLRHYDLVELYLTPSFCVILKQKAEDAV